jgi:hypothetical protein
LEREVQGVLKHPDIVERLRVMDATPAGIIGSDVRARLKADRADYAKVIAAANMHIN